MMVLVEALVATTIVVFARYQLRNTRGGRKEGREKGEIRE
jgi:hypothetical protein